MKINSGACKRILLTLLVLTQFNFAQADTVYYIRMPSVDASEYQSMLSVHSNAASVDELLKRNLKSNLIQELKDDFIKAQNTFLESELSALDDPWLKVISYAFKSDWSTSEREAIQIAFFRLAQMAKTGGQTEKWLKEALIFDNQYIPNPQLFPPPLIAQFEKLKAHEQYILITLENFSEFDHLLCNGRVIDLLGKKTIQLADGMARLTLLSSTFEPVSRIIQTRELPHFHPEKIPLAGGSCDHPIVQSHFLTSASPESLRFVFHGPCLAKIEEPKVNGKEAALEPYLLQSHTDSSAPPITESYTTKTESQFKKSWIWLGSALLVGFFVYESSSRTPSPQPSHREGF